MIEPQISLSSNLKTCGLVGGIDLEDMSICGSGRKRRLEFFEELRLEEPCIQITRVLTQRPKSLIDCIVRKIDLFVRLRYGEVEGAATERIIGATE